MGSSVKLRPFRTSSERNMVIFTRQTVASPGTTKELERNLVPTEFKERWVLRYALDWMEELRGVDIQDANAIFLDTSSSQGWGMPKGKGKANFLTQTAL